MDMVRIYGYRLVGCFNDVQFSIGSIGIAAARSDGGADWEEELQGARANLKALHDVLGELQIPVSMPVKQMMMRVHREMELGSHGMNMVTMSKLQEVIKVVAAELNTHALVFVPSERAVLLDKPVEQFGEVAVRRFPDIADDVSNAAQAIALGQGNAAVFHLMRVLERGLHDLARNLNVTMAATIELENWQNVIDQIDSKIRDDSKLLAQSRKRGPLPEDKVAADVRLQRLSHLAKEFSYFKDAWRNHVSHSRSSYDPEQARSVWNHVSEFMRKMAALV